MKDILMSPKESKRVYLMEKVVEGQLNAPAAANMLGLSERHIFRLKGAIKTEGIGALAHKNRGKKPKHAVAESVRQEVIAMALNEYRGASYAHASELLAEHKKIQLSAKTVGRILKAAGLKHQHTHKPPRRHKSRNRRSQEGALIQIDASQFDWLEERGPRLTLHGAIDDATSKVVALCFRPTEDGEGYMRMLEQVITSAGVPLSAYSDRHTIFFSPNSDKLSFEDEVAGRKVPLTQFGRALAQLEIEHIPARTPQAKGRIERLWGTLQERLVIELRIAGITSMEDANAFLSDFIARHNKRFGVVAASEEKVYKPTPSQAQLERIICWQEERKASHGSAISFKAQKYQLIDSKGDIVLLPARCKVLVLTALDGNLRVLYGDRLYALKALTTPQPAAKTNPTVTKEVIPSQKLPGRNQIAYGKALRPIRPAENLLVRTM